MLEITGMVDELVLENIPLINLTIKQMNLRWETEDEYQEFFDYGMEGLIRGAQTFKEEMGYKKSTYLYKCIRTEIGHCLTKKTTKKRWNENGRDVSLNKIIDNGEDKELEFGDFIEDPNVNIEEEVEHKILMERVFNAIDNLKDEQDKTIIKMYFGLDGYEQHSLWKIANKFGVSQNAIKFRKDKAIRLLKKYLEKNDRDITIRKKRKGIYMETNQIISKPNAEVVNINPLQVINTTLMDQLDKLKSLDMKNKEEAKLEIARSNAISTVSKTVLQSIGIQMLIKKNDFKPLIEKDNA